MSATDELRRMLTEAGVEWKTWNGVHPITVWRDETYLYEFVEYGLINDAKQVSDCPSNNDGYCELTINVFNCTPAQAIAATLGGDSSDTVKRLMELQGGHYSWPTLYETVTGDPFDYHCPPSESEAVFIKKLIGIVGGRKVVGE